LLIPAYDLTYHRPIAFMADRHFKTARFLGIDPFSRPYIGGGFAALRDGVDKAKEWYTELENAHERYVDNKGIKNVPFTLHNIGEAQLPIQKNLTEFFRYRKCLVDDDMNISLSSIARCSAAAPGYLAPGRIENFFQETDQDGLDRHLDCCDGGVVANSPALAAFNVQFFQACANFERVNKEAASYADDTPPLSLLDLLGVSNFPQHMVLSIGCGQTTREVHPEQAPSGLRSYFSNRGNLIDVLMSSNAQLSHANTDALFASQNSWENYLRVQLSVNKPAREEPSPGGINNKTLFDKLSRMDDTSPEALKVYKEAGEYLAEVYRPLIKKFVQRMLKEEGDNYWDNRIIQAILAHTPWDQDPWKNRALIGILERKGFYKIGNSTRI